MADYEYRTIPIAPAAMTRNPRWAKRRQRELEAIQANGWEIVEIQPKKFGSTKDHVTVRRRRGYKPRVTSVPTFTEVLLEPGWLKRLKRRLV